jgi:short-subunit dehydrogenase
MKLALVTGASGGLGKALCIALAHQGIELIAVARNQNALSALQQELTVPVTILPIDLSHPQEREPLIELIHRTSPDVVINNAGFGLYGPILSHPASSMAEMIEVNIQALAHITIEASRALIASKKKGTILNISSAAAFFSYPTFATYAASKRFVLQFSEALDEELSPQGVRVLTVCPGQIATGFRARASSHFPQQEDAYTLSQEKAARLILKQIEQGARSRVIDNRYRLMVYLSRLIPQRLLMKILSRSLSHRY